MFTAPTIKLFPLAKTKFSDSKFDNSILPIAVLASTKSLVAKYNCHSPALQKYILPPLSCRLLCVAAFSLPPTFLGGGRGISPNPCVSLTVRPRAPRPDPSTPFVEFFPEVLFETNEKTPVPKLTDATTSIPSTHPHRPGIRFRNLITLQRDEVCHRILHRAHRRR